MAPLTYGSYSNHCISLERHELRLPRWRADGFRVALVADLHTDTPDAAECANRAVRMAVEEQVDLIAIPGDFLVHSSKVKFRQLQHALEPLNDAKCPVVGTLGNHDYASRAFSRLVQTLRSTTMTLLINQKVDVQGVTVAGVDDALLGRPRTDFLGSGTDSESLLALLHEPDYVTIMPPHVSLQLSGHSHGGQICFPGGRPLHTPVGARFYYAGFYPEAKVPLYVTRGVGTIGPRLRMFCPPEVSILTLRAA